MSSVPKIHVHDLRPAPGGGFYDANVPHRPVQYAASTPTPTASPATLLARFSGSKVAARGLPTPQDLLGKLPTPASATATGLPKAPDPPPAPRVQQLKVETPQAASLKPVTARAENIGPTPLRPARPAEVKVAESPADALTALVKMAEDAEDQELFALCLQEGLYANQDSTDDNQKQAYVQAEAMRISVNAQKEKDIELWRAYKANPNAQTLAPLMRALDPVINSEVNRWAGNVPRPVLQLEAKKLTLDAIKTYDPARGTALSTHVHNRLYKLSRTVYSNQDIVRMPENKKLKSQTFYNANEFLKGELGREPTQIEMADHLGWNVKTVKDVQRSMVDEFVESKDEGAADFVSVRDEQDPLLDYVYYSLSPQDQKIFEMSTGYNGHKPLTAAQIASKIGINQNQVAYRRRLIAEQVERARNLRS